MIALLTIKLDDETLERVRRNHAEAIAELQKQPSANAVFIADRSLPDGVAVRIPHGLGREPRMVIVSPPRGANSTGHINEIRTDVDRTKYIKLQAIGFTSTITVDIEVK